jgi:type IV pilus assembly protein PilA
MRTPTWFKKRGFTLVELMIVVAIIGILAVLAIYGVRKYVSNAKTAEARNSLGQVGKDATTAFERESMAGTVLAAGATTLASRALCGPASTPVPANIGNVQSKKYQSNPAAGNDWNADTATLAGFACLQFDMTAPQYYEYNYTSNGSQTPGAIAEGTAFTSTANGDLNGDNVLSTFQLLGSVVNHQLYIAPNLLETNPEE